MGKRAIFLDRDGVINIDHAYVHTIEEFHWVEGVKEACAQLTKDGWTLAIVTNQSGIGRGYYTEQAFQELSQWMCAEFEKAGAHIAGVYFCPHHPEKARPPYLQQCQCRKPAPGLIYQAAKELDLDLSSSILFGDKLSDLEAAHRAGCVERVLLGTDGLATPEPHPLATACFASLAQAVASPWYRRFMEQIS